MLQPELYNIIRASVAAGIIYLTARIAIYSAGPVWTAIHGG